MPRAAKKQTTALYNSIRVASGEMKENNDCAVVAFSVVTGMSYADSHALLKKHGRKDRKGTFMDTTCAALKEAGFNYKYWTTFDMKAIVKSYPGVHGRVMKNITPHHPDRFPEQWEPYKGKVLLMRTKKHILAYKDGKVHDWSADRALRVISILEITKA